jgi:N4-gp56 family major capsid protein
LTIFIASEYAFQAAVILITDVASETDLFKQLLIETERMGESCALKVDQLIMEEAVKGAGIKLYSGWDDFATLKNKDAKDTTINCARILAIAQLLKKKRAPKFAGGYYVGVLTPEQVFDLQQDPDWKNLNVHNRGGKAIYKNEVGEIHGVKILETTAGWTEAEENTLAANGSIYAGVFMGKGALGAVDLAGAPSAKKPQFIHNNKADKSDPLNQFQTVGWKGYFGQAVLQPNWLVVARTKTLMPSA